MILVGYNLGCGRNSMKFHLYLNRVLDNTDLTTYKIFI